MNKMTPLRVVIDMMFGVLPLCFLMMASLTLLYLLMRMPNIYDIIRMLPNLMYFPSFIVFKHLFNVNFHLRLNMFKLIEVVNIVS